MKATDLRRKVSEEVVVQEKFLQCFGAVDLWREMLDLVVSNIQFL
jgi:hypothetical protein